MAVMLGRLKVQLTDPETGEVVFRSLKGWIYGGLCSVAEPVNASLMFAVGFVLLWTAIMGVMHWRRIFLKI